ncbi:MAG: regulatory signaling modulator protein AmpE [Pseudomonadota bacterium]
MNFLALVIALGLLQYWGSAGPVHRDEWFRDFLQKLQGSGLGVAMQIAVAVLLPSLAVLWLLDLMGGLFLGLVPLAIAVVVLLYSFGRGDFEATVEQYREYCRAGNFESAFEFAQQELVHGCSSECPAGAERLHRWVKQRILYFGFERWFGVMFFFLLLGAPGALAYRLLQLARRQAEAEDAIALLDRLQFWVDWLPSRLLVFTFAVTGDWVGSREQLSTSVSDTRSATDLVLTDAGHAALGLKATVFSSDGGDMQAFAEVSDWEVGQLQGLLSRSAVAWVVIVALLVLLL